MKVCHAYDGLSCTTLTVVRKFLHESLRFIPMCFMMDPHDGTLRLRKTVNGSVMQYYNCITANLVLVLRCYFLLCMSCFVLMLQIVSI